MQFADARIFQMNRTLSPAANDIRAAGQGDLLGRLTRKGDRNQIVHGSSPTISCAEVLSGDAGLILPKRCESDQN